MPTDYNICGALHRRKTDSHDRFDNRSRNDKVVRNVGHKP